ncbi:MAG: patatin-like phospholipase family protein [Actinobacteria bacterium]|nr:patatin-like phospholipase family protein [Actinomycetota bacterium]
MSPARRPKATQAPRVAYVLGGGGHWGAYEVGMLRALLERDLIPDVIVGTSVGALNGAAIAAAPMPETVELLRSIWLGLDEDRIFGGSFFAGAANFMRTRTHLHSNAPLRKLLDDLLPAKTFEELKVPFQCVAASIERASEHWFHEGPLVPAILASAAVPGILPPVEIGGEHYLDGGIVNSIPISRAVELGATEIYVLHVGRIERELVAPRTPLQVAMVAFEIARRHRFARDLATLPQGVTAHVLPTGEPKGGRVAPLKELNYRDFKAVDGRIQRAYKASAAHLERTEARPG